MAKRQNPKASGQTRRGAGSVRNRHLVFVSHATYDKFLARVICERLEANGIATYRDDRDVEGGDSIPESIRKAIEQCDEVSVLLTPQSIQRQWVLLEIGIAIGLGKRIVPLLYHVPTDSIPESIRSNRAFDLNEFDSYLSDVVKRGMK